MRQTGRISGIYLGCEYEYLYENYFNYFSIN